MQYGNFLWKCMQFVAQFRSAHAILFPQFWKYTTSKCRNKLTLVGTYVSHTDVSDVSDTIEDTTHSFFVSKNNFPAFWPTETHTKSLEGSI